MMVVPRPRGMAANMDRESTHKTEVRLLEGLIRAFRRFNRKVAYFIGALIIAMMGLTSLNVALRYIFRFPLSWPSKFKCAVCIVGAH